MYMNMIYKTKDFTVTLLWKIVINTYFLYHSSAYILSKVKPLIGSIFYSKNLSSIQFIKNGLIIDEVFISNDLTIPLNIKLSNNILHKGKKTFYRKIEHDFIMYKHMSSTEDYTYMIRYNTLDDLINSDLNYKKSNIQFFTIILLYKMVRMKIDLNSVNEYYYIINNQLLDYSFIQYYIYKYHNLLINVSEDYEIIILDNNCKSLNLHKENHIILQDNDYSIMKSNVSNISNNEADDDEDLEKFCKEFIKEIITNAIKIENREIENREIENNEIENNEIENNDSDSKDSTDCENLSDIDCNNISRSTNQNNSERYYRYVQNTLSFFNWYSN